MRLIEIQKFKLILIKVVVNQRNIKNSLHKIIAIQICIVNV